MRGILRNSKKGEDDEEATDSDTVRFKHQEKIATASHAKYVNQQGLDAGKRRYAQGKEVYEEQYQTESSNLYGTFQENIKICTNRKSRCMQSNRSTFTNKCTCVNSIRD